MPLYGPGEIYRVAECRCRARGGSELAVSVDPFGLRLRLTLGVSRLTALAGWLTLILSFTTCTVPGFLLLLGEWDEVPTWGVLASIVATVLVLVPVALAARTSEDVAQPSSEEAVEPVRVPVSA